MHLRVALAIKKEIKKYLIGGFIIPIDYSPFISNIVHVSKPHDEIRCCTNFKDINKACPKDAFPLPSIDMIVDSTTCHEILFFINVFSSYNQIRINK